MKLHRLLSLLPLLATSLCAINLTTPNNTIANWNDATTSNPVWGCTTSVPNKTPGNNGAANSDTIYIRNNATITVNSDITPGTTSANSTIASINIGDSYAASTSNPNYGYGNLIFTTNASFHHKNAIRIVLSSRLQANSVGTLTLEANSILSATSIYVGETTASYPAANLTNSSRTPSSTGTLILKDSATLSAPLTIGTTKAINDANTNVTSTATSLRFNPTLGFVNIIGPDLTLTNNNSSTSPSIKLNNSGTLSFIATARGLSHANLSSTNASATTTIEPGFTINIDLSNYDPAPILAAGNSTAIPLLTLPPFAAGSSYTNAVININGTPSALDAATFINGNSLALTLSPSTNPASNSTRSGVIINWHHSPSPDELSNKTNIYLADPAITVAPDGSYIASHSYFGGQYSQASPITQLTPSKIFRSTDQGRTWTLVDTWERTQHVSYFTHNNTLYALSSARAFKNNADGAGGTSTFTVIRKSTDNSLTWFPNGTSTPDNSSATGCIGTSSLTTPKNPLVHNDRAWVSIGPHATILSASIHSDLMAKSSWTSKTPDSTAPAINRATPSLPPVAFPSDHYDQFQVWNEPQILASPQNGVIIVPKIEMVPVLKGNTSVPHYSYPPIAAFIRANNSTSVTFDAKNDFAALPGTEQKYAIVYDPASQKYLALTNTPLPDFETAEDPGHIGKYMPQLTRNTGTLYSSPDLLHWNLEKIFIHSNHIINTPAASAQAWHYFNFIPHNGDLLVASRTAFQTSNDTYKPPRGHDSNSITFHRIPDYQNLVPVHRIKIEAASVKRYELTDHHDAPLGNFTLGKHPQNPTALALANDNTILVQQSDGTILQYDQHGNHLGTTSTTTSGTAADESYSLVASRYSLVDGEAALSIPQPKTTQRTWNYPNSGAWYDSRNWHYWSPADTPSETATLGSANIPLNAPTTITLDRPTTINALSLRSPIPYILATGNITAQNGTLYHTGNITLATNPDTLELPTLNNHQGNHTLSTNITATAPLAITLAGNSTLHITTTLATAHPIQLHIDLAAQSPTTPPLTIANLTTSSTLAIRLSGISPANKNSATILTLANTNLSPANITLTSTDGTPLHYTLNNGTLTLIPPPPIDPSQLTPDQLLLYALTNTTDPTTNTGTTTHLPITTITNNTLSLTFTPTRQNLTYEIQQSTDLQSWLTIQTLQPSEITNTPITINSTSNTTTTPTQFLRLKITP